MTTISKRHVAETTCAVDETFDGSNPRPTTNSNKRNSCSFPKSGGGDWLKTPRTIAGTGTVGEINSGVLALEGCNDTSISKRSRMPSVTSANIHSKSKVSANHDHNRNLKTTLTTEDVHSNFQIRRCLWDSSMHKGRDRTKPCAPAMFPTVNSSTR